MINNQARIGTTARPPVHVLQRSARTVQEHESATFGLLGARHNLALSFSYVRTLKKTHTHKRGRGGEFDKAVEDKTKLKLRQPDMYTV